MRVSISLTTFPDPPPGAAGLPDHLREVVHIADETGIDTVWIADHLLQADPSSTPDAPALEALTTLGFLAACSRRVRLGAMVSPVHMRAPAVLIKAITTLDVLSDGRAWLGLGAGYTAAEADATGVPLPPVAERYDHLADTLELAHCMFADNQSPFTGRRTTATRPVNHPPPRTRPHPPILIGGMGEQRTLPLVARHADACNLFDIPDGGTTVRRKLDLLRRLCDDANRPYESVEKVLALTPGESAASFLDRCTAITDLGIEHVVVITRGQPWDTHAITTIAAASV